MPLLGQAAVAMWWNVRREQRAEYEDWHSHEHMPERIGVPGFRRSSRWSSVNDAGSTFMLHELDRHETLSSTEYLERLNNPTPWSTKMMPHLLDMTRSQCRVEASFGGGVAASLATIRLSPQETRGAELRAALVKMLQREASKPGMTGAHLLVTDAPKTTLPTAEERLRGSNNAADWIILLSGYDSTEVQNALDRLSPLKLQEFGARELAISSSYALSFAVTPTDSQSP